MEELSDTVGDISLMVINMARRVAHRDVEHWKATVRYTGLAGFVGGLFPTMSGLMPSPAQSVEKPPPQSADLLADMKTSMGEPLLHWSANLVRNTSYRIAQAWPFHQRNVVPALSKLVTEAVIGLEVPLTPSATPLLLNPCPLALPLCGAAGRRACAQRQSHPQLRGAVHAGLGCRTSWLYAQLRPTSRRRSHRLWSAPSPQAAGRCLLRCPRWAACWRRWRCCWT
jgi:hypothetical protein